MISQIPLIGKGLLLDSSNEVARGKDFDVIKDYIRKVGVLRSTITFFLSTGNKSCNDCVNHLPSCIDGVIYNFCTYMEKQAKNSNARPFFT